MRIRSSGRYVTFTVEGDGERAELLAIAGDVAGQTFRVDTINGETLSLRAAGPGKAEGAKPRPGKETAGPPEPINITYDDTAMPLRLISNLAETGFEFDGRCYSSVEGFWQGLKFPEDADRERLAALSGHEAKRAGPKAEPGDRFVYEGREVVTGTVDHWALMEKASLAKFEQDEDARAALLSTGTRQLVHHVAIDSRTIPGVIMADIWMRLRERLAQPKETYTLERKF